MAEEKKDGQAEPVSEDGMGHSEVKKENGAAQSPVKHVNGSAQEDKVNGVESQTAGKECETEEVEQNGHKPEGEEDSMEEADQDDEGAEGSMFVTECTWCGAQYFNLAAEWSTLQVWLKVEEASSGQEFGSLWFY